MIGGGGTRSRSTVLSPRGTGDRQPSDPSRRTQHEARRRVASDAKNQFPEQQREYLLKCPSTGSVPRTSPPVTKTQASAKNTAATSTSPARRATATSTHGRAQQEILHVAREPRVMPAATRKRSRTFQVARFLGRLPVSRWDGRPVGSTQGSIFSRSRHLPCHVAPSRARAPVLGLAAEMS